MSPKTSIIIPTFNRAHLIGETLNSVLAQTHTNWECIVIDDGSTDSTVNIVNTYAKKDHRIQCHSRPTNRKKGANACRNYGFEISKGNLINWIDSDDILTTDHLQIHIEAHNSQQTDAVVTNTRTFKNTTNNIISGWSNIQPKTDIVLEMIQLQTLWAIGAVSWKRDSIGNLPFNEELASSQEWTFHLKQMIQKKTFSIFEDKTTYLVRSHDQRIGKDVSQKKCYSTFMSRRLVFNMLLANNQLTKTKEKELLVRMFKSLRDALRLGYNKLFVKQVKLLFNQFGKTTYKAEVLKKIFVSAPVYKLTGKGDKLFEIK